jgi:cytochrome c556
MMDRAVTAVRIAVLAVSFMPGVAAHENHDHATGVVKERMVNMENMAKRLKAINDRLKEKRELGAIKADAEAISELATHVAHLFPAGSTQHPTQARSAIWQNWPDFERRARVLLAASRKLAGSNSNDAGALAAQARALTQACSGCHEKYRVRKQ